MYVHEPVIFVKDPHKFLPVLLDCIPDDYDQGPRTVRTLAALYGTTQQTIYSWVRTGRIRPTHAEKLSAMSKGKVPLRRFRKFTEAYFKNLS